MTRFNTINQPVSTRQYTNVLGVEMFDVQLIATGESLGTVWQGPTGLWLAVEPDKRPAASRPTMTGAMNSLIRRYFQC